MINECIHDYIFSGSLPENASTYVKREADDELYEALEQGKFCYVLNSRQSGKSSLRLRTMSRLSQTGVECASIDLSSINIQGATQENWYADLITILINSFALDVNFKDWWENNQLNSPLMRFTNFLEKHLLVEIEEPVVIFIDEIDSVLSLNFPTDDFFAFIRACYNQRVDNPAYKRLTFCLLGVASPSNLIQDKQRTPFNIGKAISLKGFKLEEVAPLERGLRGKFKDSQAVMQEILDWTGGQPFLTQKLCQFMVEETEEEKPRTVKEVVKSRIITSWESQDEPEHLRTIRSRILRNEERAGYLLELYQQIRLNELESAITADNTIEQSELLLSGLVTRREGKLKVYNAIYKEVFNKNWVENELKNLRPYSENFRFWVASGGKDESRLLRGKALADAIEWAKDKNLSYQDKQFLAASREKEIQSKIAAEEQEAQLERERKDKEAAEQRNLVLSEANRKARQRIRNGTIVLVLTMLGAAIVGLIASKNVVKANYQVTKAQKDVETKQKEVLEAQEIIKKLESEETYIRKQAEAAIKREQKATKNQKAAEKELDNKKRILAQTDELRRKSEQQVKEFKIKVKESSQKLEDSKQQFSLVNNSREELKTQIIQIRQDKERSQQELSKAQSELKSTQQQYNNFQKQVVNSQEYLKTVAILAEKAGQLEDEGSDSEAKELFSQAGQSVNIKDHKLRQAVLYNGISYAFQKLKSKNLKKSQEYLDKSKELLKDLQHNNSKEALQSRILTFKTEANLFKEQGNIQQAINSYHKAYKILENIKDKGKRGNKIVNNVSPPFQNLQIKILSNENVEALHREFIDLLSESGYKNLKSQVKESLIEHSLDELNNLLANRKWEEADNRTTRLMLYVANGKETRYLYSDSLKNFSCQRLKDIDSLWVQHSNERFGFRVQKQIWKNTGNRLGITIWTKKDNENYYRFASRVGWYDKNEGSVSSQSVYRMVRKDYQQAPLGILPKLYDRVHRIGGGTFRAGGATPIPHPISMHFSLNSRAEDCEL